MNYRLKSLVYGVFLTAVVSAGAYGQETITTDNTNTNNTTVTSTTDNTNVNTNTNTNTNTNNNTTNYTGVNTNTNTNTNNNNNVSTSTNVNTNTNNNNNVSTSTNVNTNNNVLSGGTNNTNTNSNTNINTSTSDINSTSNNTNTNSNTNNTTVNETSDATINSTSNNTNTNNNTNNNTSDITSNNTNSNTNSNTNDTTVESTSNNTNTNSNTNNNNNVSKIEQEIKSPPPSAIAPNISANNMDMCTTGISGAVQTQILGIAGGATVRDMNCERLKLSKTLYDMGMKVAAVSVMCQDERVFGAMEMSGTPCPFMGDIGEEASAAWSVMPELRPDADEHRARQEYIDDVKEAIANGEDTTKIEMRKPLDVNKKSFLSGLGVGALLLLLL
jgi:hypothetical protein